MFQAINGTAPYNTTLGSTLSSGTAVQSIADSRTNWDSGDGQSGRVTELPAISVFQGETEVEDRDDENQKVFRKMSLMIRGVLPRASTAASARAFLADIQRAIRLVAGDTWIVSGTALAHHTDEGPHMIEYDETYEVIGVQQQIFIYYIGSKFDLEA